MQVSLKPRNGRQFIVGIFARISGCQGQKEQSLDDQVAHGKSVAREVLPGPFRFKRFKTIGKGERLDRKELKRLRRLLKRKLLDLLVVEDLGRMVRGVEAVKLLGIAFDNETRVIAPNDCVDTANSSWEADAISACRDHVSHQSHTSKRLKDKLMNRHKDHGGATSLPIAGYIVPPGAKTYADWRIEPEATPIIEEGARRLFEHGNCSLLADWFNEFGFPRGPYSRNKRWDCASVRRFYRTPLLKGEPTRGFRHTVKHHETGKRVSVKSPHSPVPFHAEHLRHLSDEVFDELNAFLDQRNANRSRSLSTGVDPLVGIPRKRTRFPGQFARCYYCGRHYVWGANGISEHLSCTGSRGWSCWNSIGIGGRLVTELVVKEVCAALHQLEGFQEQFEAMLAEATSKSSASIDRRAAHLRQLQVELDVKKHRIKEAISTYGTSSTIEEMLAEANEMENALESERHRLARQHKKQLILPKSPQAIRMAMEDQFQSLAIDSPEFGSLLQRIVPEIFIYLVRLCDGGHPVARAQVTINLGGTYPDLNLLPELQTLCTYVKHLDLFVPPQRELIRQDCVRLEALGVKQRDIAHELGVTQPAVGNAIALHRMMESLGLESPYIVLLEPPADYSKLRRHKHPRFHFETLEGYTPPQL